MTVFVALVTLRLRSVSTGPSRTVSTLQNFKRPASRFGRCAIDFRASSVFKCAWIISYLMHFDATLERKDYIATEGSLGSAAMNDVI